MNQVFVRFIPTWEVDPEPIKPIIATLEQKESFYNQMLSSAIGLDSQYEGTDWKLERGKCYIFDGKIYYPHFYASEKANLLEIDLSYCKYFPDVLESPLPLTVYTWKKWGERVGNTQRSYITREGDFSGSSFELGKVYLLESLVSRFFNP